MLVLSRKEGESIVVNDDVTITVVEMRGDKVRLGIEAPRDIPVHRREVFDAIGRLRDAIHENPESVATRPEHATQEPGGEPGNDTHD